MPDFDISELILLVRCLWKPATEVPNSLASLLSNLGCSEFQRSNQSIDVKVKVDLKQKSQIEQLNLLYPQIKLERVKIEHEVDDLWDEE